MSRDLKGPEIYEHRVTDYLESFFKDLGVSYERQAVAPLRENIVARAKLGGARQTLVLEVHQDTVPADNMTIEPFGGRLESGRVYGRGACDIKGGMASMLTAFARIVKEKPAGAANIVMACTVDEEHTSLGAQRLVKSLKADMVVVAEPTSLRIINAHKGVIRWHLTTRGLSAHSSTPDRGVNAIYLMGRVLTAVELYAKRLSQSRTDPLLGPPTLSVGRIDGGTSVNTVPDHCQIQIDLRLIPGDDPSRTIQEFVEFAKQSTGSDLAFECSEPWVRCPALNPDGSEELVERLGQAIDQVKGSHEVVAVPFCTDASTIAQAGIPAVVFGPGDIAQAHMDDEWVSVEEVEQASEILYKLACNG
jgi:acetylornithine deacetylase